ncbi:MAG: DUF4363 family protein [Clostridia bacterium]|nr:DUF4363 family protein [Clostridia bacterium]
MKKIISVLVISAMLLTAVILEQVFVQNTLDTLLAKIDTFDAEIQKVSDINSQTLLNLGKDLDEYWTEKEKILCLSINHNDLNKVGEQIKKIVVYVDQNNKDDCIYELEILKFYAKSYKHVMEITPQNLL